MEADSNQLRRDVAFIQGLMAGSQGLEQTPQGIVLQRMVSVLDELAAENEQLQLRMDELEEYVEAIDEDLSEVELVVYDEDLWENDEAFASEIDLDEEVDPEELVTLDADDAS
ncbi:CD1247 N-terminal domain-containing protein [Marininema halotolerans]|uniref:Uncharacterized protein n=1 Tax=Marininema halotolerans TaxID=1155944 RepID=A0A1I6TW14_9BACL|nr:CD1247 N-terminal domain-containing protein [Marininema halotolerans]SFS93376.1 hypothetical protein SAMN05444972_111120 [Marininema halotolerans]